MKLSWICAALAASALGTTVANAQDIKIGVAGPFTGGSSSMGVSMRDGVRLAVEEINKAGGVLGRPDAVSSSATTKPRTSAACRSPRS